MWVNSPETRGVLCGWQHRVCPEASGALFFWTRLVSFHFFIPKASPGIFLLWFIILTFFRHFGFRGHCFGRGANFPVPLNVFGDVFVHVAVALGELPPPLCLVASDPLSLGLWGRALQGVYPVHLVVKLGVEMQVRRFQASASLVLMQHNSLVVDLPRQAMPQSIKIILELQTRKTTLLARLDFWVQFQMTDTIKL